MSQDLVVSHPVRSSPEEKNASTFLGIRRSALVEMAALLSCLTIVDQVFFATAPGTPYLIHPYWLALFLITIQYGMAEAVTCALLASLLLIVGSLPQQGMTQTFYDYVKTITALPFLWTGFALIAGPLRNRQIQERDHLRLHLTHALDKEKTVTTRYKQVCKIKEKLETRLAQEKNSLVTAYQTAQWFQTLKEEEVFEGLKDAIVTIINPEQFSFFTVKKHTLNCLYSKGWQKPGSQFSRRFGPSTPIYRKVISKKETLSLLRHEDEPFLDDEGMMAVPIVDTESKIVFGMLKLESLPFTEMHFHTVERCRLLGEWAGRAIANARLYRQLEQWAPEHARHLRNNAAEEEPGLVDSEADQESEQVDHAASAA